MNFSENFIWVISFEFQWILFFTSTCCTNLWDYNCMFLRNYNSNFLTKKSWFSSCDWFLNRAHSLSIKEFNNSIEYHSVESQKDLYARFNKSPLLENTSTKFDKIYYYRYHNQSPTLWKILKFIRADKTIFHNLFFQHLHSFC